MANPQLALDEANLTPDQVSAVDYRRQMGLVFQVISGQLAIMSTLMTWWIGQDIVYARPWAPPHRLLLRRRRHAHPVLRDQRHGHAPRCSPPRLTVPKFPIATAARCRLESTPKNSYG